MFPSPSEWPNPGRYHCAGLVGKVSFWSPRMLPAPWTLKFRFESWTTIFFRWFFVFIKPQWNTFWWFQPTLSWKNDGVKVSWDDDIPNWTESHNSFMFQSTNQKQSKIQIGSTMSPRKFRVESWTTIFFRSGWWFQTHWKNLSQLGLLFPLYGKIEVLFQTTKTSFWCVCPIKAPTRRWSGNQTKADRLWEIVDLLFPSYQRVTIKL